MRIGLDVDGVIYEWDKTARYMMREVCPLVTNPDDPRLRRDAQHWNEIEEIVGKEAFDWLWTEGVRLGLFRYGHLHAGAIQAIRKLATIGDVVLITSRPKQAVNDTMAFLGYLNLPIAAIHILSNSEPKSTVKPECDIFLDDKPENVVDLQNNTDTHAYLMRRPWNEHNTVLNAVTNWQQYIDAAERIAQVRYGRIAS